MSCAQVIETLLSAGCHLHGTGPEFVTSCKGSQNWSIEDPAVPKATKHVAASGAGKHIWIVTANASPGSCRSHQIFGFKESM